jgi:hypothetical protein
LHQRLLDLLYIRLFAQAADFGERVDAGDFGFGKQVGVVER